MNKIWGLLAGIQVSNMVVIECVTGRHILLIHMYIIQIAKNKIQCVNEGTLLKVQTLIKSQVD